MSEEYDDTAAAEEHLLGEDIDENTADIREENGADTTEADDLADESAALGDESTAADDTQYVDDEGGVDGEIDDDPEVQALKAQLKAMEEEGEQEAERLRQLESEAELSKGGAKVSGAPGAPAFLSPEEKKEVDARSVYVGNVDYSAAAEELEQHFHGCGSINRVTINCDKFTGHPKGFAYIEFADPDGVGAAEALDESLFKGRQIKVVAKRTNIPGHSTTNRGRGRGFPRARGGFRGYPPYRGAPAYRPRGGYRGGFRARARYGNYYSPY